METVVVLAVAAAVIVLLFAYTNGFHDAANIIATVIASRAMTPAQAVLLVGFFEFLGPMLAGTAVADTIGKFVTLGDLPAHSALTILLCGLFGAITWNLLTWRKGIPSSSSHALVGGLAGVVVVAAGPGHVVWGFGELAHGHMTGVTKVLLALVLSPIIGFWAGYLLHRTALFLLRAARPTFNRYLRGGQFVTAAGLAFSHGANDAQKSMGCSRWSFCWGGSPTLSRYPSGSSWLVPAPPPWASSPAVGALSGRWASPSIRCARSTPWTPI